MKNRFKPLAATILWLVCALPIAAATWNVPADRSTIQAAIDSASDGDTVLVAPGTYQERIDFFGKGIAVRSTDGAGATVIDAQNGGIAVRMLRSEPSTAVLEGFTIRNGQGFDSCCWGAGLACEGCAAQIRNNVFIDNSGHSGGAISLTEGNPQFGTGPATATITGNVFRDNRASDHGGAIACFSSAPTIEGNRFENNAATGGALDAGQGPAGGAVYINTAPSATVRDNWIEANSAEHAGGGLFLIQSPGLIENNDLLNNASRNGAGIHVEASTGFGQVVIRGNALTLNRGRNLRPGDETSVLGGGIGAFRSDTLIEGNSFVRNEALGAACDTEIPGTSGCGFGSGIGLFGGTSTVRQNLVSRNVADFGGGGWFASEAGGVSATVKDNRFSDNRAFARPGVSCTDGADCTVDRNRFLDNTLRPGAPTGGALAGGGGFEIQDGSGVVTNNFVAHNVGQFGAGVKLQRSAVTFTNNTVAFNSSTNAGGGLLMEGLDGSPASAVNVFNNIFLGNNQVQLHELENVNPSVEHNLFHRSDQGVYSDWNGGAPQVKTTVDQLNNLPEAQNNLPGDPLTRAANLCEDYHLEAESAAEDQGTEGASGLPAQDIDLGDRSQGASVDIGADERGLPSPLHCPEVFEVGVFRPSTNRFFLDAAGDGGTPEQILWFGGDGDLPLIGDWNGDGLDEIGVYRPSTSFFFLDTDGGGAAEKIIHFGASGDLPLIGDWNGDGIDDVGVFRESENLFFLDTNGGGAPEETLQYGASSDQPLVGDWDGDGTDNIGVFRPSNRSFYLDLNGGGSAEIAILFGDPSTDLPLSGDWNGDGIDEIGVYRPSAGTFFLDVNDGGSPERSILFGSSADQPLVGRWID